MSLSGADFVEAVTDALTVRGYVIHEDVRIGGGGSGSFFRHVASGKRGPVHKGGNGSLQATLDAVYDALDLRT